MQFYTFSSLHKILSIIEKRSLDHDLFPPLLSFSHLTGLFTHCACCGGMRHNLAHLLIFAFTLSHFDLYKEPFPSSRSNQLTKANDTVLQRLKVTPNANQSDRTTTKFPPRKWQLPRACACGSRQKGNQREQPLSVMVPATSCVVSVLLLSSIVFADSDDDDMPRGLRNPTDCEGKHCDE